MKTWKDQNDSSLSLSLSLSAKQIKMIPNMLVARNLEPGKRGDWCSI